MVLAYSHFKLLPTSTLDIHKVFEHIAILSMCIWQYLKQLRPAYMA
jgi:hypothetical protein